MKNRLFILTYLVGGLLSAQTDPKTPPDYELPAVVLQSDTTSIQTTKKSDLKTMDAVQTKDHPKTTPKIANDTVTNKTKRKGSGVVAKP